MKYFLVGAFATGFLVYGMALIYGASGTTIAARRWPRPGADQARRSCSHRRGWLPARGARSGSRSRRCRSTCGRPMRTKARRRRSPASWRPASRPPRSPRSSACSAPRFGARRRCRSARSAGRSPLVVIAALTMTVGNLAALRQDNIKRMLAYSSIAHAGYLLLGVVRARPGRRRRRAGRCVYYLSPTRFTTLGAFGVVAGSASTQRRAAARRRLGRAWRAQHPGVALAMTIFLLSLGGMPPTGGLLRQVLPVPRRDGGRHGQLLWLVLLGVAQQPDQHLLLPARSSPRCTSARRTAPFTPPGRRASCSSSSRCPAPGPRARPHAGLVVEADRLGRRDRASRARGATAALRNPAPARLRVLLIFRGDPQHRYRLSPSRASALSTSPKRFTACISRRTVTRSRALLALPPALVERRSVCFGASGKGDGVAGRVEDDDLAGAVEGRAFGDDEGRVP